MAFKPIYRVDFKQNSLQPTIPNTSKWPEMMMPTVAGQSHDWTAQGLKLGANLTATNAQASSGVYVLPPLGFAKDFTLRFQVEFELPYADIAAKANELRGGPWAVGINLWSAQDPHLDVDKPAFPITCQFRPNGAVRLNVPNADDDPSFDKNAMLSMQSYAELRGLRLFPPALFTLTVDLDRSHIPQTPSFGAAVLGLTQTTVQSNGPPVTTVTTQLRKFVATKLPAGHMDTRIVAAGPAVGIVSNEGTAHATIRSFTIWNMWKPLWPGP